MNEARSECVVSSSAESSPARRATRRTMRHASGWPIRSPVEVMNSGPIRPAAEVVIERSHNRRRQHGPILFAALADDAQDPVPPVVAQVLEGQPDR